MHHCVGLLASPLSRQGPACIREAQDTWLLTGVGALQGLPGNSGHGKYWPCSRRNPKLHRCQGLGACGVEEMCPQAWAVSSHQPLSSRSRLWSHKWPVGTSRGEPEQGWTRRMSHCATGAKADRGCGVCPTHKVALKPTKKYLYSCCF
jgi:hypothetical protein